MLTSVCQRWRNRRGIYRPTGEPIDPRHYEVAVIQDDRTPKTFVEAHHYSASYPAARFRFGLYRGAELVGVAVFSHPANNATLACLPGTLLESTELGRLVLLDDVPANGETWFLARCFEGLRREGLKGIISFSDPVARTDVAGREVFKGHIGTIYQAFNGIYLGRANPDVLRLLPDGSVLHRRAIAKLRHREKGWRYVVKRLQAFGASPLSEIGDADVYLDQWLPALTRKVRHPGNHKYVWAFERGARKTLLHQAKDYPKFELKLR